MSLFTKVTSSTRAANPTQELLASILSVCGVETSRACSHFSHKATIHEDTASRAKLCSEIRNASNLSTIFNGAWKLNKKTVQGNKSRDGPEAFNKCNLLKAALLSESEIKMLPNFKVRCLTLPYKTKVLVSRFTVLAAHITDQHKCTVTSQLALCLHSTTVPFPHCYPEATGSPPSYANHWPLFSPFKR